MSLPSAPDLLVQFLGDAPAAAVDVGPGDIRVMQADVQGRPTLWVCFDYAAQQGSIGVREAQQLVAALEVAQEAAQATQARLVLVMESSGIRVTDSTAGIASLRKVVRAAARARLAGVRMLAVVGRCAFGGASILACMGERCLVFADTVMAMSGPRLIAQSMAPGAFDAGDAAEVRRWLGGRARADACARMALAEDADDARAQVWDWLGSDAPASLEAGGEAPTPMEEIPIEKTQADLALELARRVLGEVPWQVRARLSDHVHHLASPAHADLQVLTLAAPATGERAGAGVGDAKALLQALRQTTHTANAANTRWLIVLDVQSHRAHLDDEQAVFSAVLADLVMAMRTLAQGGVDVRLAITGRCGGGILAALSAGAVWVGMAADARLTVLPPAALQALGKQESQQAGSLAVALEVGVADGDLDVLRSNYQSK